MTSKSLLKLLAEILKKFQFEEYGHADFTYASGFKPYSTSDASNETPMATKQGNIVTLSGAFAKDGAQSSAGDIDIGYVPSGCEPAHEVRFVAHGSGQSVFLLYIRKNGSMAVGRYGTTTNTAIPNNAWLNISCTYIAY